MSELVEGVLEMAEAVPQLAPTALEGVAMNEEAAVVQELVEGLPEMAVGVLQLTPTVPVVDDDTVETQELLEGVPEMVE